jgi:hypothetical protein
MDEDVRLIVYRTFAATGHAPTADVIGEQVGTDRENVIRSLHRLHEARHIVLDLDERIVMAHPFAAIPLGFSVMGRDTLWWGGCVWDSFALPHLLVDEPDVLVATRCPACDRPHAWVVGRDTAPPGDQVAHFLVPVAHMWDDVVYTCGHQRVFCDRSCVMSWLDRTGNEPGAILALETVWRLASRWYEGRLERGYERRDPESAKAYLREVGLSGRFWGL